MHSQIVGGYDELNGVKNAHLFSRLVTSSELRILSLLTCSVLPPVLRISHYVCRVFLAALLGLRSFTLAVFSAQSVRS